MSLFVPHEDRVALEVLFLVARDNGVELVVQVVHHQVEVIVELVQHELMGVVAGNLLSLLLVFFTAEE